MTSKNNNRIIAVTGATGFTGGWVVEELLKQGFSVRATVRDLNNKKSYEFLQKLAADKYPRPAASASPATPPSISFFAADFSKRGSYDAAFAGAEAVIHVAAVTELEFPSGDPFKEIITPGVEGAREIGAAARRSGTVKRIVLTASASLVDQFDREREPQYRGKPFVEEECKHDLRPHRVPYVLEKVLSEKAIAEAFGSAGFVISLLPTLIIGPQQNPFVRSSMTLLKMLAKREVPFAPRTFASWIDVRDCAIAHVAALDLDVAALTLSFPTNLRRYIISSKEVISTADLAKSMNKSYPGVLNAPEILMPHWMLWLASWFDGRVTEYVRFDLSERRAEMSGRRASEELKFERRHTSLDQTVKDVIESFYDYGVLLERNATKND